MSTTTKPLVLVLGATGNTGQSVVDGLLKSGNFRVAALVRSGSIQKPSVGAMRATGVEIRVGDLTDDFDKLKTHLHGVDIFISTVASSMLDQQKDFFRAAKEVGVSRVVPSDFATPGENGPFHPSKLSIHEYIKSLDLPYTFIDVGAWMQVFLPLPPRSAVSPMMKTASRTAIVPGTAPVLLTDLNSIGTFVARIVADPRTINQQVIIWEDERPMHAAWDVGALASGEPDAMNALKISVTHDELARQLAAAQAAIAADPTDMRAHVSNFWFGYLRSICVFQEATRENAARLGYLDARALYPDVPVRTLEEFASEFYALPEPGYVYNWAN